MEFEPKIVREKRDELAKERINIRRNPITGLCIEPEKLKKLNETIYSLTKQIELPNT
jgi:hypothetical protein